MQRYVSRELFHFLGRNAANDEARFAILVDILESGVLLPNPKHPHHDFAMRTSYGVPLSSNEAYATDVVCFCDIPFDDREIHMKKYSRFGISFLKSFLSKKGASPVFYVAKGSPVQVNPLNLKSPLTPRGQLFDNVVEAYWQLNSAYTRLDNLDPQLRQAIQWLKLALDVHILPFMKFFDELADVEAEENYYMEREWRVVGPVRFNLSDIHRIVLPEKWAAEFRSRLPSFNKQISFA